MTKILHPVRPLADVNVLTQADQSHEIVVCFMPDPVLIVGEGRSQALLALDASASLRSEYGYGGAFGGQPNFVEMVARKIGALLTEVTQTGKAEAIYWAVSHDGSQIEPLGEYDAQAWEQIEIIGPRQHVWGKGTQLLPAIQYCVDNTAQNSDWTMGVFITDGVIEDETECLEYCFQLGQKLAQGQHNPLKLVLIGVGKQIDKAQLERFDDMFEGTALQVDLWSTGIAYSMRDEADILNVLYGELMDETMQVAAYGEVRDSHNHLLKSWSEGLPGKFRFTLPAGETQFTIIAETHQIVQDISEVLGDNRLNL
ncbi:MAG: hypothetical protein SVR94_05455 [Pseudomonadota bacterium]|nr:hypothetical protein [Pseudomonadota bacterium]